MPTPCAESGQLIDIHSYGDQLAQATSELARSFEKISFAFNWILRGGLLSAEGRGRESKYTTSGVRACRLESGLRVLLDGVDQGAALCPI